MCNPTENWKGFGVINSRTNLLQIKVGVTKSSKTSKKHCKKEKEMASSKGIGIGGSASGTETAAPHTPVAMELEKLSVEQLKAVKEQADLEVNLLQDSLNNVRTATARLDIASNALNDLSLRPKGIF